MKSEKRLQEYKMENQRKIEEQKEKEKKCYREIQKQRR